MQLTPVLFNIKVLATHSGPLKPGQTDQSIFVRQHALTYNATLYSNFFLNHTLNNSALKPAI